MRAVPQSAVETYRYLRVGIVALAVLLMVAVVGEIVFGDAGLLGSISAYYFTSARDVLVGVLFALGLGLIVIRGRGAEDVLLNLAGMLATVVAVVPTPLSAADRAAVGAVTPFEPTGAWSLLVLAAAGLVFAALTARRLDGDARVQAVRGLVAAAGLVLVLGAWLVLHVDSFAQAVHFVAAVGMFGLLVVVARLEAAAAQDAEDGPVNRMLPAARRRAGYRLISWSMLAAVALAGVLGLLQLLGVVPVPFWLFWVETLLLALFAAFWVLQTVEYWREGVPLD